MASPTKRVKVRRKLRRAKMNPKRKNAERRHSTAKNLPLNRPNAQERAQKAAKK